MTMDPPLTAGHPMMDVRVSTSRSRERRHYDNRRGDHRRRGGGGGGGGGRGDRRTNVNNDQYGYGYVYGSRTSICLGRDDAYGGMANAAIMIMTK